MTRAWILAMAAGAVATSAAGTFDALAQSAKEKAKNAAPVVREASVATPQKFKAPEPVSVKRGEKIFVEYCAVCHGMGGKGDGPRAAFFADTQYIPDLTADGFLEDRDEELLNGIREGLNRFDEPAIIMPQFKNILSENDIRSALAYIKTFAPPLQKKPVPAAKKK